MQESVVYRVEGRRLQEEGQLQEALASYQKALVANPNYPDAYNDLGVVLESLQDLSGAEAAYRKALELNPGLLAAHANLALLYERLGRLQEAAVHWGARIVKGLPDDPWVKKSRQKLIQYNLPVPESPSELAQKRRAEIPLAYEAGRRHLAQGRFSEAIAEFERVLSLDPEHAGAIQNLKASQRKLEKTQRAKEAQIEKARAKALKKLADQRGEEVPEVEEIPQEPRQEGARRKDEEAARREAEAARRQVEEARRRAEEERPTEEARYRQEELRRRIEETKRREEEFRRRAEQARARHEEVRRLAQEARRKVEEARWKEQATRRQEEMEQQVALLAKEVPIPRVVPEKPPAKAAVEPVKAEQVKVREQTALPAEAQGLAQEFAQQKLEARKQSVKELYRKALVAMGQGQFQEAANLFEQLLVLEPAHRQAREGYQRVQAVLAASER